MYVSEYNGMLCNGQETPIRNPLLLADHDDDDDDYNDYDYRRECDDYNDHNDDIRSSEISDLR